MLTRDFDSIHDVLSTGTIIAIVIGSIFGVILCIASIVIIICIIKHCSRSRYPPTEGMILQESYVYPHSWSTQYPPNITSVTNYPPAYNSAPPPYTASSTDYIKPPYT